MVERGLTDLLRNGGKIVLPTAAPLTPGSAIPGQRILETMNLFLLPDKSVIVRMKACIQPDPITNSETTTSEF